MAKTTDSKKAVKDKDKLKKQGGKKSSKAAKKAALQRKKRRKGFLVFLLVMLILVSLTLGFRFFVFETAKVKTGAMSPRYRAGDTVVINKLMDIGDIKRGDLVYASFSSSGSKLIRRVAGVEGDEILIREDGNKYLVPSDSSPEINLGAAEGLAGGILQKGQYLLLSYDLDDNSALDSRQLGLVTGDSFIGTPGTIIWPPARMFKK